MIFFSFLTDQPNGDADQQGDNNDDEDNNDDAGNNSDDDDDDDEADINMGWLTDSDSNSDFM